jgi:hypothetical protein
LEELKKDPTLKQETKAFIKLHAMLGKMADQLKKQIAKGGAGRQGGKGIINPQAMDGMENILKLVGDQKLKELKLQIEEARKDRETAADTRRKYSVTAANIHSATPNRWVTVKAF